MKTLLITTGIVMAVINIVFIIWAVARYMACCREKKQQTLEAHRNKFIDTPE